MGKHPSKKERDPYAVECGVRLALIRQAMDFNTIRAFAAHMDIEEDTLGAWESGKNMVRLAFVRRLWKEENIPMEYIYDDDPSRLPHSLALKVIQRVS